MGTLEISIPVVKHTSTKALNVLILEDSLSDAQLMVHNLSSAGYELVWQQVETEGEYVRNLQPEVDIILADYTLPEFSAMRALEILQKSGLEIPLIVITGSIGEEIAVECMKSGAADYLLKDSLVRLASAVSHAIEQRQLREQKRQAENALRESERRYRLLADNVTDVIWTMDLDLNFTYITPSVESLLGYTVAELVQQKFERFLTPASLALAEQSWQAEMAMNAWEGLAANPTLMMELECIRRDGSTVWVEAKISYLWESEGAPIGILGLVREVTERRLARQAILSREAYYRSLIENSAEIITILNADGSIRYESPSVERALGYMPEELVGKHFSDLLHIDDIPKVSRTFEEYLSVPGVGPSMEIRFRYKRGGWRVLESRGNNLLHDPAVSGIVVNSHDVTSRKQAEEELRYLSTHDALTGLYNRAFFEAEFARLQRSRLFPVSVFMVDVDGLKDTNDTEGHAAGDELLRQAAELLQVQFRAEDVIARIGGDEFATLLPATDLPAANEILARVRRGIIEHAAARDGTPLSLSLGTATAISPGELGEALKRADRRMYRDKTERTKPRDTSPLRL